MRFLQLFKNETVTFVVEKGRHFECKVNIFRIDAVTSLLFRPLRAVSSMFLDIVLGSSQEKKDSRARFRSLDLWVMGPARFHCATLLRRTVFDALLI